MDPDAFYYTLSTICQTLAGAFGILMAVALYKIQILERRLAEEYRLTSGQRAPATPELVDAEGQNNWEALGRFLIDNPLREFPSDGQTTAKTQWEEQSKNQARFIKDLGLLQSLKLEMSRACWLTFASIVIALVLLPCAPWFKELFLTGCLVLGVALATAIGSLAFYIGLVLKVVNPNPRPSVNTKRHSPTVS
jgi:hypothetical protein